MKRLRASSPSSHPSSQSVIEPSGGIITLSLQLTDVPPHGTEGRESMKSRNRESFHPQVEAHLEEVGVEREEVLPIVRAHRVRARDAAAIVLLAREFGKRPFEVAREML